MPAKTGASHAIASFGSIVLGAYISAHTSLVTGLSRSIGESVLSTVGLSLPESVTGMLLISTGLAFLWGVAYHFARHGSDAPSTPSQPDTSASAPARDDGIAVPEPLAGVVSEPYSSPDSIASADAELRSHLTTELSVARSVLDDMHDRFVEVDDRDGASRAGSLSDTLRQVEQRLTARQDAVPADAVSLRDRSAMVSIHTDLVTAVDRLHEELDALDQSNPDADGEHFETARRRIRDLQTAIERRQQRLDQGGSP